MANNKSKISGVLEDIEQMVQSSVGVLVGTEEVVVLGDSPDHIEGVDFGVNVVGLAKRFGLSPVDLAKDLVEVIGKKIEGDDFSWVSRVVSVGPFVNIEINVDLVGREVVGRIIEQGGDYGKEREGGKGKVVVDMSSPNIAKRMNYGHLRSTVIGAAIANLYEVGGYEVVRDNHIGDWGTQYGKLMVAIEKWGSMQKLKKADDPIGYLQELYVKFHDEVDKQAEVEKDGEVVVETELEREGREAFSKLEKGDKQVRELWKMCVDLSMKEFEKIYQFLGVKFDVALGESFYKDKLEETMELVEKSDCGTISEGALVVDMDDVGLGVSIVRKSDGASVYMTRDLACAMYRAEEMKADKAIYVVGEDQKLYFRQLFEILKRLGVEIGSKSEHIYFGMVRLKEGKMSTRKGRTVLLKDVIEEGVNRVEKTLKEKGVRLDDEAVRQIVAGALKWNDLGQDARRSMVFDWDEALNMQGYSAPYVQYAVVRAKSLLKKAGYERGVGVEGKRVDGVYGDETERDLVKMLMKYSRVLKEAMEHNDPSRLAVLIYSLAKHFSTFYNKTQIIGSDDGLIWARLRLVDAVSQTIENGLGVLGIEVPKKM